jgi:hypothetical protein
MKHHCPHIWSRSKIFCTVITLLSSFLNNYLNVNYFSMISYDTELMVIHEWYYHCCSQLISLCDYHTDTITDWVPTSMYLWFDNHIKFHKHSQLVLITMMLTVESQGGKTYRTHLKDFKGIQFFSILQTIWISPSQSYNWSGSQLHNPTNVWMLHLIWVSTSQSYKCLDVTYDLGLNFTILQMSGCYKWSGSQLHSPTNVWMLWMILLSISQSYKSSGSHLHKTLQPAYIWNMWIKNSIWILMYTNLHCKIFFYELRTTVANP